MAPPPNALELANSEPIKNRPLNGFPSCLLTNLLFKRPNR